MSLVHLEEIVGTRVRDVDGKVVGRLEEVHADWHGPQCVVTFYVIAARGRYVLRQLGILKRTRSFVVPWNRMNWSDPMRPRLDCRTADL